MLKKLTALLAALMALAICAPALAEVYEGATAALSTQVVVADVPGLVQGIDAAVGDHVDAGDSLLSLKGERIYAAQDGTVSLVNAHAGDAIDGTLMEIAPLERYTIHCTVDKAYQSAESTLVHSGETLYVRCTADGTHRAVGVVTQVDGGEYLVVTVGGELYMGETVYLYRDAAFTTSQRVGIGTAVASDTHGYEASGTVTRLAVGEGDAVERGQLLCEINGGEIAAPVCGILASLGVRKGDGVEEGQVLAEIVPDGQVCVEIEVSETDAARFKTGQRVTLTLTRDPDETTFDGTVVESAWVAEDGAYTVRILPEAGVALPLGLSVTVRTAEE